MGFQHLLSEEEYADLLRQIQEVVLLKAGQLDGGDVVDMGRSHVEVDSTPRGVVEFQREQPVGFPDRGYGCGVEPVAAVQCGYDVGVSSFAVGDDDDHEGVFGPEEVYELCGVPNAMSVTEMFDAMLAVGEVTQLEQEGRLSAVGDAVLDKAIHSVDIGFEYVGSSKRRFVQAVEVAVAKTVETHVSGQTYDRLWGSCTGSLQHTMLGFDADKVFVGMAVPLTKAVFRDKVQYPIGMSLAWYARMGMLGLAKGVKFVRKGTEWFTTDHGLPFEHSLAKVLREYVEVQCAVDSGGWRPFMDTALSKYRKIFGSANGHVSLSSRYEALIEKFVGYDTFVYRRSPPEDALYESMMMAVTNRCSRYDGAGFNGFSPGDKRLIELKIQLDRGFFQECFDKEYGEFVMGLLGRATSVSLSEMILWLYVGVAHGKCSGFKISRKGSGWKFSVCDASPTDSLVHLMEHVSRFDQGE